MLKIIVGELHCALTDAKYNLEALAVIRNVCKARPSGYKFMAKFKRHQWDGYISLMSTFAAFPTGLLSFVLEELHEAGYANVEVSQQPVLMPQVAITKDMLTGIELRDYQLEAVKALTIATRGVAKMATNSGKTEVMAAVIKHLGCKSIVLVHRKELMYQTAERFTTRGIENVGMCGDGLWQPNIVTVAMIQTLSSKIDLLGDFIGNKVLFCDETHHLSGAQSQEVYYKLPGRYRFGVSGTPLKREELADMKLMAATGPIVCEITNEFMIDHGYSAKPRVDIKVIDGDTFWLADYQSAYTEMIVNNVKRNKYIAKYAKRINGAVLILVARIEHGRILQELTDGKFLSGGDTIEDRRAALEVMKAGTGIFIASPIFDEGVDVPGVHAVILAGGGKSQVKLLQRIGRGLRHKEDNSDLKILDFIDDTNKHLLKHSNDRIETYVAEGFETVIS